MFGIFMSLPSAKVKIVPDGGWEPLTWYLVNVSLNSNNPIHIKFLYTGFLDKNGNPSGYSGLSSTNYIDNEPSSYHGVYYLKVIKRLFSDEELRSIGRKQMNDFDRAEMKHDLDKAMNYYPDEGICLRCEEDEVAEGYEWCEHCLEIIKARNMFNIEKFNDIANGRDWDDR